MFDNLVRAILHSRIKHNYNLEDYYHTVWMGMHTDIITEAGEDNTRHARERNSRTSAQAADIRALVCVAIDVCTLFETISAPHINSVAVSS